MPQPKAQNKGRILYDDGVVVMRRVRQAAPVDSIVVTFPGYDQTDITLPGFGETLLHGAGYDLICVQKRSNNGYQSMSREAFGKAVKPTLSRYRRICFYGSSVGAYAALYFGRGQRADILALSPRNSLHPIYAEVLGRRGPPSTPFTHEPLEAGESRAKRVTVVYDPVPRTDRLEHADLRLLRECVEPAFPQLTHVSLRHTGHPAATALAEVHLLRPAVLNFMRGHAFNVTPFRRMKGRSPYYMLNLSRWLEKHGRWRQAEAVVDRGLRLFPASGFLKAQKERLAQERAAREAIGAAGAAP